MTPINYFDSFSLAQLILCHMALEECVPTTRMRKIHKKRFLVHFITPQEKQASPAIVHEVLW
eukprot:1161748-Pelagomonas_calceolata.AAC.2